MVLQERNLAQRELAARTEELEKEAAAARTALVDTEAALRTQFAAQASSMATDYAGRALALRVEKDELMAEAIRAVRPSMTATCTV